MVCVRTDRRALRTELRLLHAAYRTAVLPERGTGLQHQSERCHLSAPLPGTGSYLVGCILHIRQHCEKGKVSALLGSQGLQFSR